MRVAISSTSGTMRLVIVDMRPKDVIDFIREVGHQCILDIEPASFEHADETLTIEVYDDYRE